MSPDGPNPESPDTGSVLSNLPRHRPGRPTSRRTAAASARSGAAKPASNGARAASARGSATSKRAAGSSARGAKKRAAGGSARREIVIPEQGFEVEEEARISRSVEPPSPVEVVTSIIELAGEGLEELIKASVSAAGSVLKRTLELIPKP